MNNTDLDFFGEPEVNKMTTSLQAGQRFRLGERKKLTIKVEIQADQPSVFRSALLVCKGGLGVAPPIGVVYQNSPTNSLVKCSANGAQYDCDLTKFAKKTDRVVVIFWVTNRARKAGTLLASAGKISVSIFDGENEIAVFSPPPSSNKSASAAVYLEIYYKNAWRIRADGSGFLSGLPAMAARIGLENEDLRKMDHKDDDSGKNRIIGGIRKNSSLENSNSKEGFSLLPVRLPKHQDSWTRAQIPTKILACVGQLHTITENGTVYTGTAFAITPGGCLITCQHVIEDGKFFFVTIGNEKRRRPVVVLVENAQLDIALVRLLDADGFEQWLELEFDPSVAPLGSEVGLLGYSMKMLGEEVSYTQGFVNSHRHSHEQLIFQVDAGAAPGVSGGPLFLRESGKVIGILGSGLRGQNMGMHVNLAISVNALKNSNWVI